jgi:GNAT superfamily N-acetyltransferase
VRALVKLHSDCSADSVRRRFLTPMPVLSVQLAQRLLVPTSGFSLLADRNGRLAGIATIAPAADGAAEVGLLVADRDQRQGVGTALLSATAREAAGAGFTQLLMLLHPDNHGVVTVVSSAGLRARVSTRDGLTSIHASLGGLRRPPAAARLG